MVPCSCRTYYVCTVYPFQRNLHSLDFYHWKNLCVINPTRHIAERSQKAQLSNKQCEHSKALSQNLTSVTLARGGNNITITHTLYDIQRNLYSFTRAGPILNEYFCGPFSLFPVVKIEAKFSDDLFSMFCHIHKTWPILSKIGMAIFNNFFFKWS